MTLMGIFRQSRQKLVQEWGIQAFGLDETTNPAQRALRFLEEALELYQAVNARDNSVVVSPNKAKETAHRLVDFVFNREVGKLDQEFGGVGVTLLALAEALHMDADQCEAVEIERCLARSPTEMSQRNRDKNDAGFKA